MDNSVIEDKRNQLNLLIRELLTLIDLIDGDKKIYEDYITNSLNECEYLDQQIKLMVDAKTRLLKVFKE